MQFYNLKTRRHVDIPENEVKKKKVTRKTKSGEQTRYVLTAEYQGSTLSKFVNEKTFASMNVPEVS